MEKTVDFDILTAKAIQLVAKFVVPLYVMRRNMPVLIGSGFFIAINGKTILISAAHVLNLLSDTSPLFTFEKPDQLIQIGGKRYLSDPNELDLGFIVTSNVSLPWPEVEISPCGFDYLCAERTPRAGKHFVITGYPETKNRVDPSNRTIKAEIHAYHARSIPDEEYVVHKLDPQRHVALPLDLKKAYSLDGVHRNFPKPQGMSGSPIWELYDESLYPDQPRMFPIVAVGTTYKNRIIYGADVGELSKKLLDSI